jgi:hypothetical protein
MTGAGRMGLPPRGHVRTRPFRVARKRGNTTGMKPTGRIRSAWQALYQVTGLEQVIGKGDRPPVASELGRLLWTDPRPLILPRQRMIVVFSPKSACTSVVIWFFHQLGHLKAARDYASWPHRYRTEVYYKSRVYQRAFERDLSRYSLVRIVRDPFERAVSSFRHVQKGGLADKPMSKVLGRSDMSTAGLSFSEFLDFLERCDLTSCDPHFRLQRHPIEDRLPTRHLINASTDDLFARLNQVEADYGLPITDFDKLEWLRKIHPGHTHVAAPIVSADAYTHRFNRDDARSGSWPGYDAFLIPAARERLARLYATDIEAYGNRPKDRGRQQPALAGSSNPD